MNFSQLGFGFFVLKINGIFLALTFVIATLFYYREIIREKLDKDFFVHHFWRWIVGGLILGRIISLVLNLNIFQEYGILSPLAFWIGGINFYGFLIGLIGVMIRDLSIHNFDYPKWLDLAVPSFLIAVLLADLAEFLTGSVYGTETSLPWGIQYETFGVDTIAPVHPVTIYGFIIHLILLNWVLKYGQKLYRQKGNLFIITGILFFFAEFFLQFFRGDSTFTVLGKMRIEQVFSFILVFGLVFLLNNKHKLIKIK